jgi:hypothetical protein
VGQGASPKDVTLVFEILLHTSTMSSGQLELLSNISRHLAYLPHGLMNVKYTELTDGGQ